MVVIQAQLPRVKPPFFLCSVAKMVWYKPVSLKKQEERGVVVMMGDWGGGMV